MVSPVCLVRQGKIAEWAQRKDKQWQQIEYTQVFNVVKMFWR